MKLAWTIFLVIILGNGCVVRALMCYSCMGSKTSDCYNGKSSSMVIQACPQIPPSSLHSYVLGSVFSGSAYQEVCVKVVETNTNPDMFLRSCAVLPSNVDPCDFIKQQLPVSSCSYCRTDLCDAPE